MVRSILFTFCCYIFISAGFGQVTTYPALKGNKYQSQNYTVQVRGADASGTGIGSYKSSFTFEYLKSYRAAPSVNLAALSDNHWTTFAFEPSGQATQAQIVVAKTSGNISSVEFRPTTAVNSHSISGGKLELTMNSNTRVAVFINGDTKQPLFLFCDPAETGAPNKNGANVFVVQDGTTTKNNPLKLSDIPTGTKTVYFEEGGIHYIFDQTANRGLQLTNDDNGNRLNSNIIEKIYIPGGALVVGAIRASRATGLTISGRGILAGEESYDYCESGDYFKDRIMNSAIYMGEYFGTVNRNQEVKDVTMLMPLKYSIQVAAYAKVHHCKVFAFHQTTDGVGAEDNAEIYDNFFKVNDDVIKIYNDNMNVHDNMIWHQDNGAGFQFGWGSESGKGSRITNTIILMDDSYVAKGTGWWSNHSIINWHMANNKTHEDIIFDGINNKGMPAVNMWVFLGINMDSERGTGGSGGTMKDFHIRNAKIGKEKWFSHVGATNGSSSVEVNLKDVTIDGVCMNASNLSKTANVTVTPATGCGGGVADPIDPEITFTAPAKNATINGTYTVTVKTFDVDYGTNHGDGITSVLYQLFSTADLSVAIETKTVTSLPFSWALNTENLSDGEYELRAGVQSEDYTAGRKWATVTPISIMNANMQIPEIPTLLSATATGQTTIDLTWKDNGGQPATFIIRQKDGATFVTLDEIPASSTNYTVTGLDADTEYTFIIKAKNSTGTSGASNEATATTNAAPLLGDDGILTDGSFENSTNIDTDGSWTLQSEFVTQTTEQVRSGVSAAKFQKASGNYLEPEYDMTKLFDCYGTGSYTMKMYVYVPASNDGTVELYLVHGSNTAPYFQPKDVRNQWVEIENTFTYTKGDGLVLKGKTYGGPTGATFYVDDMSLTTNNANSCNTKPATPASVLAVATGKTSIDITWEDPDGNAESFQLFRSIDNSNWTSIATTDVTSFSDASLTPNTEYFYKIKATNAAGTSDFSSTANAKTDAEPTDVPDAPTNISATVTGISIALTWKDNSDNEDNFVVERSLDGTNWSVIAEPKANSYTDNGLIPNTQYYYQISAVNVIGSSDYLTTNKTTGDAPTGAGLSLYPGLPNDVFKSGVFDVNIRMANASGTGIGSYEDSYVYEYLRTTGSGVYSKDVLSDNHWTTFSYSPSGAGDAQVQLQISLTSEDITSFELRPSTNTTSAKITNGKLYITMEENKVVTVIVNDDIKKPLFLFCDPAETNVPDMASNDVFVVNPGDFSETNPFRISDVPVGKKAIYFTPGIHHAYDENDPISQNGGGLVLTDNTGKRIGNNTIEQIYIPGGAMVITTIRAPFVNNLTVSGRGIIAGEYGHPYHSMGNDYLYDRIANSAIYMGDYNGTVDRNQVVDGITSILPLKYNIQVGAYAVVKNTKSFAFHQTTDGVGAEKGAKLYDNFFKVNDDVVKIYNSDMDIRNTYIWHQNNGASIQLGWNESQGTGSTMKNTYLLRDDAYHSSMNSGHWDNHSFINWHSTGYTNTKPVHADHVIDGINRYGMPKVPVWRFMAINLTDEKNYSPGSLGCILKNFTVMNVNLGPERDDSGMGSYIGADINNSVAEVNFINAKLNDVCINSDNITQYGDVTVTPTTGCGTELDPEDITDLVAIADDCNTVTLTWSDTNGEEGYRIRRKVAGGTFATLEDISNDRETYTDATADEKTDYVYLVRPMKGGAVMATSNTPAVSTPECSQLPADITDLSALADDCNTVTLTWTDTNDEDAYRIRRKVTGGAYEVLEDIAANVETYTDATALEGTGYIYQVRPMQSGVAVATSNTPDVTTPVCPDECLFTVTVKALPATCSADGSITLSVSDYGTRTSIKYKIGDLPYTDKIAVDQEYVTSDLPEGSYAVLAQWGNDECPNTPIETLAVGYECTPADIADLTVVADDCNAVTLTWSDTDGEDGYRIRRREIPADDTFTNLTDVSAETESYTDETAEEGKIYAYMVRPLVGGIAVKTSNTPEVTVPICPPIETTQTIELTVGWNMISLYVQPTDGYAGSVFTYASKVKKAGSFYAADRPAYLNSLTEIVAGDGYLVYNTVAELVQVTGISANATTNPGLSPAELLPGWNLVGITEDVEVTNLPLEIEMVKDRDQFYINGNNTSTLEILKKGKAYWIYK